mgnify:CR=1 FL=1
MYNFKPKSPSKNKGKHQQRWFKKGMTVTLNNSLSLFEPPILIASEQHAKALHASQDKGHRYNEI